MKEHWLRSIIWSTETASSLSGETSQHRDMILPSADLDKDRRIVLSGLDRIWRFYIRLDSEKKQLCNSSLRKSTNHLICYLDLIILQKFDPIQLRALFGNLFRFNEIYPLKCSTLKRSYFSGIIFHFFFRHLCTYISSLKLVYIGTICWNAAQHRGSIFCMFWFRICSLSSHSHHENFSRNYSDTQFRILIFSHFLRVQPACQQSIMMDVLAGVASITLSL